MLAVNTKMDFDIVIAGGGLAGLTSAILLSRAGKKVLLIEKKIYPFHKVCGEYVSNEVLPFLQSLGFDPFHYGASRISKLRISSPKGKSIFVNLDMGGFGLSRYCIDHALAELAKENGTEIYTATVSDIIYKENYFEIRTNESEIIKSKFVLGCYGKRDSIDKKLKRNFIQSHTRYMAVKYHILTDYPVNEIGLDNFKNGYCGISKIEKQKYNLCYLYRRSKNDNYKSVQEIEENVLFQNPVLHSLFSNAEFCFPQPEVINEISFAEKKVVEEHILMCGDSAGLITPLCGNGMAMAISGAKLLCDLMLNNGVTENISESSRLEFEKQYSKLWKQKFGLRLNTGRVLQSLFGRPAFTGFAIASIHSIPAVERWLISHTHGKELLIEK